MKKKLFLLLLPIMCICMLTSLFACGKTDDNSAEQSEQQESNEQTTLKNFTGITFTDKTVSYTGSEQSLLATGVPQDATVEYSNNKGTNVGTYTAQVSVSKEGYNTFTKSATLTIMPSAKQIVDARTATKNNTSQNYDFNISLGTTVSLAGISQTLNGYYDGMYRLNQNTGELSFKRTTSGSLLYDATEYIYLKNDTKIKIKTNEDGVVKKVSAVSSDTEELTLINLPFVAIIDNLKENNISNIKKSTVTGYAYQATIALQSDNSILQKLYGTLEKMGSQVSFKDITLSNPASGITMYFNIANNQSFTDFSYQAQLSFPVKSVGVQVTVSYKQNAATSTVSIPSVKGFYTSSSDITAQLATLQTAENNAKNGNAYSIQVTAENEFDPGWNVTAITDKYLSTLYKNVNEERTDFNNSFEYKTHSETDGKETYKYTIGNIQNGDIYRVSRKGSNATEKVTDITLDSTLNTISALYSFSQTAIDCIQKESKDGATLYHVFLSDESTLSVQEKITNLINSCPAEDVVKADNYLNTAEYLIQNSEVTFTVKNNALVSVDIETKIKYCPTDGDYTEEKITLTDTVSIVFNDEDALEKAQEYSAPSKAEAVLVGLNAAKYYIQ